MANLDTGNAAGVTDKRHGRGKTTTVLASVSGGHLKDIASMRARLTSAGYSSRSLDIMSHNDMVYAIRKLDDAAGIK